MRLESDEQEKLKTDSLCDDLVIDCSNANTITCQAALLTRATAIENTVKEAYQNADINVTEKPALEAAWECFQGIVPACSARQATYHHRAA
ncbi:MAG: hypothetical protein JSU70_20300 [Phycisphaerales bacterium]|nr:MAG: hypothetical protein JSU70_20300 [Phycisphaerales bacterium]